MYQSAGQPIDVLMSNLEFLHDYLHELSGKLRAMGDEEGAEVASGWASLPLEASDALSSLLDRSARAKVD